MIVGGVILGIFGIISLIGGIAANNNAMFQIASAISGGSGSPGTIWIVVGIIALIAGGTMISYGMKQKKT